MAVSYRAKFAEISVGINHNVDELLVGLLHQIRLKCEQTGAYTKIEYFFITSKINLLSLVPGGSLLEMKLELCFEISVLVRRIN